MKSHTFVLVIVSCFALLGSAWAQPSGQKSGGKKGPAQKSAADTALEQFGKAIGDTMAKPSQAGFQNVIVAGMKVLVESPTHNRVNDVIRDLSTFGSAMREKSVAHLRPVYVSQLKYEIVNHRYKEGLSDEAKAAVAALDAAVADYELRESGTRQSFDTLREKIDALAKQPGAGRFLRAREQSYVEVLTLGVSPARGEAHLKTLVEHTDKGVADWAKEELALVEIRKQPFDLKFTGMDGKPFDLAQHRGKIVALVFWSNANQGSTRELLALQEVYNNYRRRGFEIVTVACDKAEDREKVAKFAKDNRIAWPVHFDGTAMESEVGKKLIVRRVPAIALFDKEGILISNNLRANRVGAEIDRLLAPKKEAPRKT